MRHRIGTALLAALAWIALPAAQQGAAQPAAQQPPPSFRVEIDYVEVDAFVTDTSGRVVTGLTAADFEVFEDGRRQTVTSFARVEIPVERGDRALFTTQRVEADVQNNGSVEGRIYLLVLDDLHTDMARAPRVKSAARRFIEQNFGVNDLAAVVYTGGRPRDSQEFTNNRRLLLASIDKFSGRKFSSATVQRIQMPGVNPTTGAVEPGDDRDKFEREARARSTVSTVRKLAEFMSGVRGRRKAMLLIGEGLEFDEFESVGVSGSVESPDGLISATATAIRRETQEAIAAATRGNVTIYAIDPRGLLTGTEDLIAVGGTFDDQGVGSASIVREQRLAQDSLRDIASRTGGFAAINRNDMNSAFDRIVAENSSYYMLGYHAANDRREGRFRKLEVRVARPGLLVRSRNGYYEARRGATSPPPPAGPNGLPAAVASALGSPIPLAGLPMRVFAAPFKGAAPNASLAIAIEVDASRLEFVEKGGLFTEGLDIALTAIEAGGKSYPGEHHIVGLNFKPDNYTRARERGIRVLSEHHLPAGRHQLRIAAANKSGAVSGGVLYEIEIPDFYKLPLSMSGVAITSTTSGQTPTIKARDPLAGRLPAPATAQREFGRGEALALFVEFYENAGNAPAHQLLLKAQLRAEGGRVVREAAEQRSSAEMMGKSGGYGFAPRFALADLEPGLYILHVEGQARYGDQPTVSRDIQLRIR